MAQIMDALELLTKDVYSSSLEFFEVPVRNSYPHTHGCSDKYFTRDEIVVETAKALIRSAEGWEPKRYYDSMGNPTVGYGFKLEPGATGLYGYPIDPMSISDGDKVLDIIINQNNEILDNEMKVSEWGLSVAQRATLLDMAYNLGIAGLQTFTTFLSYVKSGNYGAACKDLQSTLWWQQVGIRAVRDAVNITIQENTKYLNYL